MERKENKMVLDKSLALKLNVTYKLKYFKGIKKLSSQDKENLTRFWQNGFGEFLTMISVQIGFYVKTISINPDYSGKIIFKLDPILRGEWNIPLTQVISYLHQQFPMHGIDLSYIESTSDSIEVSFA